MQTIWHYHDYASIRNKAIVEYIKKKFIKMTREMGEGVCVCLDGGFTRMDRLCLNVCVLPAVNNAQVLNGWLSL